jgi:UDP-N-acetylglucosamine 1-carboxyvinyltransferase
VEQKEGRIICTSNGLVGARYRFEKNTHTGTETLIMAGVKAKGKTILENAAEETEIDDMIDFLNSMGGRIKRLPGRVIEIEGVEHLHGAIHKIMPDQNQVVSFAVAALATKGDIVVENARVNELESFLEKLDAIGAGYEVGSYGIRFFYKEELHSTDVMTAIHPGFKTDWQPLWVTLMTQAQGTSIVHETISQSRFQYVPSLLEMGATIELFNPVVKNPEEVYNFNWADRKDTDLHAARIRGPSTLRGGTFDIVDLRHGATLMIAGMVAQGETVLHDPKKHIDRGYEGLDDQLNTMGAKIERIEN